jgi:hypothetical protein
VVRVSGPGGLLSLYAGQDREQLRAAWREAWRRHLQGLPLEPLQVQMSDLITMHPEYTQHLDGVVAVDSASTNAFLHLALHLALREQIATNRPAGIAQVHQRLAAADRDAHAAEHRMIGVLGQVLWDAQRAGRMPDEHSYLEALRKL